MAGLDAFARRVAVDLPGWHPADHETMDRFRALMDDDLDTPGAMALMFDLVRKVNAALDAGDAAAAAPLAGAVMAICEAVGLELRSEVGEIPPEVAALAAERDEARAAKDFAAGRRHPGRAAGRGLGRRGHRERHPRASALRKPC